jgi:hypothetical protein
MKAPDIFAFIAVLLLVSLLIFWGLSTFGMARLLQNHAPVKTHLLKENKKSIKKKRN